MRYFIHITLKIHLIQNEMSGRGLKSLSEDTAETALARAKFQPVPMLFGKEKSDLFPKFWLNCEYGYTSETTYEQNCHQDLSDEAPRFAVNGFDSKMTLISNSKKCESGQVSLDFFLRLSTNDTEVNQIKAQMIPNSKISKEIIDQIFEQKNFFLLYFKNFYSSWAKSL